MTYTHPHVLVIDEVGYLTYGPDAANVLFHVVNDRHLRKRPMIFTTNKPLTAWGNVLHDEDLAAAILDRILERGRLVHLDGPSGRTRHLEPGDILPASTERLRIFGITGSEFPEPTTRDFLLNTVKRLCLTRATLMLCCDASAEFVVPLTVARVMVSQRIIERQMRIGEKCSIRG